MAIKYGSKVRCVRGHPDERVLCEGAIYEVALFIKGGLGSWDSGGEIEVDSLVVARKDDKSGDFIPSYPYVWSCSRFEEV